MIRQINKTGNRSNAVKDIACFLGFLFCLVCTALIAVDAYRTLDLHANGYTAEATVTENLRKSKARVQFTDYSGNAQTAIISRIRIFHDDKANGGRYTIRYSPRYPERAIVDEMPDVLVSWLVKIIAFPLSILFAFALFPYSWFKKKGASD